jgi:hypothetical protein
MIGHLATAQGVSEVIEQRKVSGEAEDAEKYEFEVVVEMPDPNNPQRMLYRTGYAEEPKEAYEKYDKFAKAKAHTKAFRNACMKLLPQDLIIATIYKLAKLVPADWTPRQPLQQRQSRALPPPKQNGTAETATDNAMKACFAVFGKKEADLLKNGVAKKDFWDALGKVLDVKSRDDMTIVQWNQVRTALEKKPYGKIVEDVIDTLKAPKPNATETETETGASPSTEGDIPF